MGVRTPCKWTARRITGDGVTDRGLCLRSSRSRSSSAGCSARRRCASSWCASASSPAGHRAFAAPWRWLLSDTCSSQVGLDAAGKTTILYKLKLGEIVTTIPTIGEPSLPHQRDVSPLMAPRWSLNAPTLQASGWRGLASRAGRWVRDRSFDAQVSTWRRSSTRTSASPCGTSVVRTRCGPAAALNMIVAVLSHAVRAG